jgi:HSP20 family protein
MLGNWDPFAEMSRLQDEFARVAAGRGRRRELAFQPAVDIYEEKDAMYVKAELPGVSPEDVNISVENHLLTISGERKFERNTDRDGYHRVECAYGSFARSFALPNTVNVEAIEANLEHGILTLRLPKRAEAQPRRIQVKASVDGQEKRVITAKSEPTKEQGLS